MSNLREAFAATALASLEWNPLTEAAIDRVAASGRAQTLGVLLWRAKYMLESSAYQNALKLALGVYEERYRDSEEVAKAIVTQALREYLAPACRSCKGVGEMMVNLRRIVCETCGGSKIHRHSDEERARLMQISYGLTKKSAHKVAWMLGMLGNEDKLVNRELNIQLERQTA